MDVPEIEKVGQVCEKGMCLAGWPKLEPAAGWHYERGPSLHNSANIILQSFGSRFGHLQSADQPLATAI